MLGQQRLFAVRRTHNERAGYDDHPPGRRACAAIAANIALGSINAIIDGEWDQTKFRNGCIKSAVVAAALVAVYFAGYLNPDLMVVEVDGQTVNLMTAVSLAMLAAFTAYAVDVLKKLKDMLSTATPGADAVPTALPSGEGKKTIPPPRRNDL